MLTRPGYHPRLVDERIDRLLANFGAVAVEGSKWCGKTWTSLHHAASVYYVGDPAGDFQNRRLASLDPTYALDGDPPHLIDEWQEVPGLWDATRFAVDQSISKGRFILTGSSVPPRQATAHSGVGRIARVRMRPMSLAESGDSTGAVSLAALFDGKLGRHRRVVRLDEIIRLVCRGGWPGATTLDAAGAQEVARQYIAVTADEDMRRLDGSRRDPTKTRRLLASLARNTMTQATNKTILKDVAVAGSFAERTLINYLAALRRLYVLEELPAWLPRLRSATRLRVTPKKYLVDPSLAVAALGASPATLEADINTFGFLFENLVIRDLKIYANHLDGRVYHYRDDEGLEVDAIVELADGRWAGFEVKLGAAEADAAADSLLRLRAKLTARGTRPPTCLAVICGVAEFAYTREDGVHVVPLTALGA
jgi:predicted AAA+ superfamily ATPase